jgi:hypothetical protein
VLDAAPFDHRALAHAVARMIWLFQECRGAPLSAVAISRQDRRSRCGLQLAHRGSAKGIDRDSPLRGASPHACDWNDIPHSPCHGDLTLENILVANERGIVFIDCDDAWVSSFWLDMGKALSGFGRPLVHSPASTNPMRRRSVSTNALLKLDPARR